MAVAVARILAFTAAASSLACIILGVYYANQKNTQGDKTGIPGDHAIEDRRLYAQVCPSSTIPNSNRDTSLTACRGPNGTECEYECATGYHKIGRHVCQTYTLEGDTIPTIDHRFFGGRCVRLCSKLSCAPDEVPIRTNSSDASGPCLKTACFSKDDAFKNLARSNYEIWRTARDVRTGMYRNVVDVVYGSPVDARACGEVTGIGVAMESLAHAQGFINLTEAQDRVMLTLRAYDGQVPGYTSPKNALGWLPTYSLIATGKMLGTEWSAITTGWWALGLLFAKRYFERADPGSESTKLISTLVDKLVSSVKWESMLCTDPKMGPQGTGRIDPQGTGISVLFYNDTTTCRVLNAGAAAPQADGYYEFNGEYFPQVWVAYLQICGSFPEGQCPNKPIENMWKAWNGRRFHPQFEYQGHKLLTMYAAYHVQLPFYLMHAVNSDPEYQKLIHSHWLADMAFYNSSAYYAGERGRYGMGAGPVDSWCVKTGWTQCHDTHEPAICYLMDGLLYNAPGQQHCRTYSPYHVVGYLPTATDTIVPHVLDLLADGDAVLPVGETYNVLWRKSLVDPSYVQGFGITNIDFASETFGLAAHSLGMDFFEYMTDHKPKATYEVVL